MLIKDLHRSTDEEEKKAIRAKLVELLTESGSEDEREAIELGLLKDELGSS